MPDLSPEQQRLIAILRYLEDWDKLNSTPCVSVHDYRANLVVFQADVQSIPAIRLNGLDSDNEPLWMEIPRLSKSPPPLPRENLKDWVIIKDDPKFRPEHVNSIELPPEEEGGKPKIVFFDSELEDEFEAYIEFEWMPWSKEELVKRKCIALYEKVFHLQQTIENAGTESPIEVVWGMGMAVWNTKGFKVCHPIVTQQVEVLPLEGDMTLRVRPTSRDPQIEGDQFLPMELPDLPAFEKAAKTLLEKTEATPSPFEEDSFSAIAKAAATQLDTAGQYWPDEKDYTRGALPEATANLVVTDSWVLFARKRSTNFLIEDLKRLQGTVEEQGVPPGAPAYLVEEPVGALTEPPEIHFRGISTAGASSNSGKLQELFFPKPFNEEQVEIIRRLGSISLLRDIREGD